jgi:hypothetical protein
LEHGWLCRAKFRRAEVTGGDILARLEGKDMERLFAFHKIDVCTASLGRFLSEHRKTIGAYFFMAYLASQLDTAREVAAKALQKIEENAPEFDGQSLTVAMTYYSETNSRNLLTNTADNLLCYISEILQEVVKQRPEILKSSERVTTEEVLQFTRFEDLIAFIADRKINDLAYGGLRGMSAFLSDRLGVEIFENDEQRLLVTLLVELRNIHTHNRGVISQLFLNRVGIAEFGGSHLERGQFFHVDLDLFSQLAQAAVDVVARLDSLLALKFALTRHKRELPTDIASVIGLPPLRRGFRGRRGTADAARKN